MLKTHLNLLTIHQTFCSDLPQAYSTPGDSHNLRHLQSKTTQKLATVCSFVLIFHLTSVIIAENYATRKYLAKNSSPPCQQASLCQSQICNQVSCDIGVAVHHCWPTYYIQTGNARTCTDVSNSGLFVTGRDRKTLYLFLDLSLFHTHTDATVLSSQLCFQTRVSGTVSHSVE